MIELIKTAIDNQDWIEIESWAVCNPSKFFGALNVRGVRSLGVKRRIWLEAKCDSLRDLPHEGYGLIRSQVIAEQILGCIIM